jgi:hypothetical protein
LPTRAEEHSLLLAGHRHEVRGEDNRVLQARSVVQGERDMKVKYFAGTDTALVEFTDNEVAETKEISENI